MTQEQIPPAGWYPDPMGGSSQRYWDGTAWGVARTSADPAVRRRRRRRIGWIVGAVVLLVAATCVTVPVVIFTQTAGPSSADLDAALGALVLPAEFHQLRDVQAGNRLCLDECPRAQRLYSSPLPPEATDQALMAALARAGYACDTKCWHRDGVTITADIFSVATANATYSPALPVDQGRDTEFYLQAVPS